MATPKQAWLLALEHPELRSTILWDSLQPPLVTQAKYPEQPIDDIELCNCKQRTVAMTYGHTKALKEQLKDGPCPLEGIAGKILAWKDSEVKRNRTWNKLMDLQDPKVMARDLRELRKKSLSILDGPYSNDHAASKYLLAMGERPAKLDVEVKKQIKDYNGKLMNRLVREWHPSTCNCQPCQDRLRSMGSTGINWGSSEPWTCGCQILGPGDRESVAPCSRHRKALIWADYEEHCRQIEEAGHEGK